MKSPFNSKLEELSEEVFNLEKELPFNTPNRHTLYLVRKAIYDAKNELNERFRREQENIS